MFPGFFPHKDKLEVLASVLESCDRPAIAFSGGQDSTFLAWFLRAFLDRRPHCLLADSALLSRRERTYALRTAEELGLPLDSINLGLLDVPMIRSNSAQRCYHCKKELMSHFKKRAREVGCSILLDGTHAGDRGFRPGRRALVELEVLSPLERAGLNKQAMGEILRAAGLSSWTRPSQSCLATRVAYGMPLSASLLGRIEQAEDLLWKLGCRQVRVRCERWGARIEVDPRDFSLLVHEENRKEVLSRLEDLRFVRVALDLKGYRSGSWDEGPEPGDAGTAAENRVARDLL